MSKDEELIDNLPLEIRNLLLVRQLEQTGKMDIEVFKNDKNSHREVGGMTWIYTPEKENVWWNIFHAENTQLFYEIFPKNSCICTILKHLDFNH